MLFPGLHHRRFIGELPRLQLRIDQITIEGNLEAPPAGGDELELLDLLLVSREQIGRQTDGFRLVVSD
jgi:hypothetical protein